MTDRERIGGLLSTFEELEDVPEEERHWEALDAIIQGARRFIFNPESGELERIMVPDAMPGEMTGQQVDVYHAICFYRHRHGRAPLLRELAERLDMTERVVQGRIAPLRQLGRVVAVRGSARSLRIVS